MFKNKNNIENDNYYLITNLLSHLRLYQVITICCAIAITFLIICILSLFPLKEIRPVLVALEDSSNTVAVIKSIEGKSKSEQTTYLIRFFLVRYIKQRETIDRNQNVAFSNIISVLHQSNYDVGEVYKNVLQNENHPSTLANFERQILKSSQGTLIGTSLKEINNDEFVTVYSFRFEFKIEDRNVRINYFGTPQTIVVNLSGYFKNQQVVKLSSLNVNPLGLVVTNYSVYYPSELENELEVLIKANSGKNVKNVKKSK